MEAPPIAAHELAQLNYVFCACVHGDHLEVPTLESSAKNQPETHFILPGGIEEDVAHLRLDRARFIWAEAGKSILLKDEMEVVPVAAAHEGFEYDQRGRHRFLGYVLRRGATTPYHPRGCVSFD